MKRKVWGALAGALLALAACGPIDDGGGGVVGDPCRTDADCASNGCCGNGTGAVGIANQPPCGTSCTNGRQPNSPCVNGGFGLVVCDGSSHCGVATSNTPGCTQ